MFKTKADFSIFDFDNRIKYPKYYVNYHGWWWSETDSGNLIFKSKTIFYTWKYVYEVSLETRVPTKCYSRNLGLGNRIRIRIFKYRK